MYINDLPVFFVQLNRTPLSQNMLLIIQHEQAEKILYYLYNVFSVVVVVVDVKMNNCLEF